MQNRCKECQSWLPDEDGRFGRCSSIAKRKTSKSADVDELFYTSNTLNKTPVKMGYAFGCIRWRPKLNPSEPSADVTEMTKDKLKELIKDNGMSPADMAEYLGVEVRRIKDWLRGSRNVPKIAVSLMKSKGLI